MVDAFIFDVDGTLVDSVDLHAHAWQEALRHFGVEVPYARVRSQIGKGGDQLIPTLVPAERVAEIQAPLAKYRGELFNEKYISRVEAFPHVRELFLALRADGKQLALASSAKQKELQIYKKLAHIEDLVDAETHADDVERSKPHPDVFQAVREALGNPAPGRCLVVGDSPFDAEGATKAGMPAIALRCGGFPEADLRHAGYRELYQDPADLLARYRESLDGTRYSAGFAAAI